MNHCQLLFDFNGEENVMASRIVAEYILSLSVTRHVTRDT
jgi:hypothetical protein